MCAVLVVLAGAGTVRAQDGWAESESEPEPEPEPEPESEPEPEPESEPGSRLDAPAEEVAEVAPNPEPVGGSEEEERPRFWRMPRDGTLRPLTLPQAVMTFRSTVSFSVVPTGASGSRARGAGYSGFSVGIFDDWEVGTTPFGVVFPLNFTDPSFYTRVRVLSGEIQLALRAEVSVPVSPQGAVWMGYGAELAWTPVPWFRFETNFEYGLHFLTPLQQTIYVPVRALFQAGPNTLSVGTGAVMYNDADDFDVPLIFRWAVSFAGYQGPLSEAALEGGIADLTNAERAWFFRGVWTFFAYP